MKSPIRRSKASATKEADTPIASAKAEIGKTRVVIVKSPSVSQERLGLCAAPFLIDISLVYRSAIHCEVELSVAIKTDGFPYRLADKGFIPEPD